MGTITINPPKTPVTKGSHGVAAATLPNVCKMPGPPAPFVPTPLPNIGKSGLSPKDYSKKVKFEGEQVAIRGASFKSEGDMASKGTGGGLVSANTHGPTKFIGPGSMNVQVEGKNVHLLGDPMLNNCGPSGSPPNAATLAGVIQSPGSPSDNLLEIKCKDAPASSSKKFDDCDKKQICAKCEEINAQAKDKKLKRRSPADQATQRRKGNAAAAAYRRTEGRKLREGKKSPEDFKTDFMHACAYQTWKNGGADPGFREPEMLSPDHVHEIQVMGHPTDPANLKWMSSRANSWIGTTMKQFQGQESDTPHTGVKADCCD